MRCYRKARYLSDLPDAMIDLAVENALRAPSAKSISSLWNMGRGVRQVPAEATAFGDRSMGWMYSVDGVWPDSEDNQANIAWARDSWTRAAPFGHQGRVYLNFPGHGEDGNALTKTAFGKSYNRLVEMKTRYDPALSGGIAAALLAVVVGFPVLRLRGHYLAVATLGFVVVLRSVINNADGLTRGALGLNGIPRLASLWLILAALALTLWVCWRLKHSSVGRSLMALRENELAAACMGVSRARARLAAFALGAFFAGIGGALWAHLLTNLTPSSFDLALAFLLVVMVVVGGSGSLFGALVAAAALVVVRELLRPVEQAAGAYGLVQIIIAVLLIATLILRPQGLFGSGEPRILRPAAWGRSAPTDRRNRPAAKPAEQQTGG